MEEADGSFQLGLSSPWPWNADSDYRIVKATDKSAEILYYARTSEPHVTVWRESPENNLYSRYSYPGTYGDAGNSINAEYRYRSF